MFVEENTEATTAAGPTGAAWKGQGADGLGRDGDRRDAPRLTVNGCPTTIAETDNELQSKLNELTMTFVLNALRPLGS